MTVGGEGTVLEDCFRGRADQQGRPMESALLGVLDDHPVVVGGRPPSPAEAEGLAAQAARTLIPVVGTGGGRALVRDRQDIHGP